MEPPFAFAFVIVNTFLLGPKATAPTHTSTPAKIVGLDYPCLALLAHIEGDVVITCTVDVSGACSGPTLVRGHPLLAHKAINNMRQWRFEHGSTDATNPVRLTYSFRIPSTPQKKGASITRFTFEYPDHVVVEGQRGTDAICPPPFKTDKVFGPKTDQFIDRH